MLKICGWSQAICKVAMAKSRDFKNTHPHPQKRKKNNCLLSFGLHIWFAFLSTTQFTSCGQIHVAVEHTVQ